MPTFEQREFLDVSLLADVKVGGASITVVLAYQLPRELDLLQHVGVAGHGTTDMGTVGGPLGEGERGRKRGNGRGGKGGDRRGRGRGEGG